MRLLAFSLGLFVLMVGSLLPHACRADPFQIVATERKCDDVDLPDTSLRAFRLANGSIRAFATHYRNRALVGSNFANLSESCSVVYEGARDPDPSHFDYKTWIAATWLAADGSVFALGHNEYQAQEIAGRCSFRDYFACWYNGIVLLRSADSGRTFQRYGSHGGVLLVPDYVDTLGQGHPRGYTNPTNLVRSGDFVYSLVAFSGLDPKDRGRCVLRSSLPITADSWQILTDDGYLKPNGSPFQGKSKLRCRYIEGVNGYVGSIAKAAGSDVFVAVVAEDDSAGGSIVAYFSRDLLHWSDRQVLVHVSLFWSSVWPISMKSARTPRSISSGVPARPGLTGLWSKPPSNSSFLRNNQFCGRRGQAWRSAEASRRQVGSTMGRAAGSRDRAHEAQDRSSGTAASLPSMDEALRACRRFSDPAQRGPGRPDQNGSNEKSRSKACAFSLSGSGRKNERSPAVAISRATSLIR